MQDSSYNAIELTFLETLINEENEQSDQDTIQMNAVSSISAYVEADEALFILFDFETPDLVERKILGADHSWQSESTFLKDSGNFSASLSKAVTLVDLTDPLILELAPILQNAFTRPIRNIILAPLSVDKTILGVIVFANPLFDFKDERRNKFLHLMVKGLSNAIFAVEHNRQLIVSKADLEASQWEILNSRNTLRTFFDNIPSSVYIVDRSYTIMAINSRRSDRAGSPPNKLVGGKCYEKLFGRTAPCALCRVTEAFDGIPAVRSLREWGAKETFIQWEITTVPIWENNQLISRAIVFDEDITEKWVLEASLIQSEKLASIGQLAANVAHEINNPLAAIIANTQLLLRDLPNPDEDTVEALQLIETAGVRAAKIVGNLLQSARKEKRDEFEEFSLNETIHDAISMANFEIKNRSIAVNLDLEKDMPNILADKNKLKGVWINLIINALGAIESSEGVISISTCYDKNEFRVVFSDNGKGILPEYQDRVFEPFFTTKDVGKGTGLGLYVSLQVVKEHHGEIHFESEPGKGTKFIVILPDTGRSEL